MQRTLISEAINNIGKEVLIAGWVDARRDHGKLIFIDLRDYTGIVQVVFSDFSEAKTLRSEWVVEIRGVVKKRAENLINSKLPTGTIEVEAKDLKIIAKAEDLPLEIKSDGRDIKEELRLKYRYLDIRRPRLAYNLRIRGKIFNFVREFLSQEGFVEIETPILTKATPEGARDFLVPSRLQPGKFYALPQSPQQYKQLLMVAGIERYFQLARCFRDEDPRADRAYGEFTQVDIEMSFSSREEVLQLTEKLWKAVIAQFFPEKKMTFSEFPRLTFAEAMEKYQTDKPDLRVNKNDPNELAFCFIIDFPLFEWKERENRWDATHHPFTAPHEEAVPDLLAGKNLGSLKSYQYDFVLNGFEVGGGSIRIVDPRVQAKVFEIMGHAPEEIEKKFGHLLEAFRYGVPPHGGIAIGADRILMVLLNESSVREVIAFPAAASGQLAVMDGPSEVEEEQLKELHIKVVE